MNINASINQSLEKENRHYHEESSCVPCTPGLDVRRGIWVKESELGKADKIGTPVFYDGENVLMVPFSHTLVTGSTGTGKSEVFYKNQLRLLATARPDLRPSFLITDLKGDISEMQAEYLRRQGYRVIVFNMRDPYRSARYNFLTRIYDDYRDAAIIEAALKNGEIDTFFEGVEYKTVKEARAAAACHRLTLLDSVERAVTELSHIIIETHDPKDKMWDDGGRTMLKALIFTMLRDSDDPRTGMDRKKFTIANVCRAAYSTRDDCDELVSWLSRADDILCVKNAIAANYRINAKVTRDGYVSTLNTALGSYTSGSIGAMTATTNDIDLREVAKSEQPYAIFVITDDRQKATNSICMLLINNLVNELIAAADNRPEHALPRDFIILADEFANMPALPNLAGKITTLRSRRIWMTMAIQSIQQLRMVYGEDVASILGDNCDLHLFLGCNNDETKDNFARSMGKKLGVKTSFNLSNDNSVSVTKSTEDVPVIRKSDLDSLELGEFFLRSRQCRNLRTAMIPYFRQNHPILPQKEHTYQAYDPDANVYDIYKVLSRA